MSTEADSRPNDESMRTLDDLLEPGSTLMVGTTSGPGSTLEFRPLTVARIDNGTIDILLDTREEWVAQFHSGDAVHATLGDNRSNDWAHLTGTAVISHDEELIDELWNPFAGAYFEDGRETKGIAALRVAVVKGRYWSTPSGRVGSLISMVSAALGKDSGAGVHGDVRV